MFRPIFFNSHKNFIQTIGAFTFPGDHFNQTVKPTGRTSRFLIHRRLTQRERGKPRIPQRGRAGWRGSKEGGSPRALPAPQMPKTLGCGQGVRGRAARGDAGPRERLPPRYGQRDPHRLSARTALSRAPALNTEHALFGFQSIKL